MDEEGQIGELIYISKQDEGERVSLYMSRASPRLDPLVRLASPRLTFIPLDALAGPAPSPPYPLHRWFFL